ncbi:hypothetical protein GCM10010415_58250 [Streptomyces atrovirens]
MVSVQEFPSGGAAHDSRQAAGPARKTGVGTSREKFSDAPSAVAHAASTAPETIRTTHATVLCLRADGNGGRDAPMDVKPQERGRFE